MPNNVFKFYDYIREANPEVYIFGADMAGKAIMRLLRDNHVIIDGFIDNNKNKCFVEVDGVYVFLNSLRTINKSAVILIGINLHS